MKTLIYIIFIGILLLNFYSCFNSSLSSKNIDDLSFESSVDNLIQKYDISGASVAVSKNGKLIFSYCSGIANRELEEKVTDSSLFRIASLSKPITSVAIMYLIENGQLKLNDNVFGENAILGITYGSIDYSEREKKITIKHLLEHTAGGTTWDSEGEGESSDPMYSKPEMTHEELIGWILDTREPSAEPGAVFCYSNFGFCLLGRVVEKITGMKYEKYVQDTILLQMGITKMRIGGNKLVDKFTNEVVYYDDYWSPYNFNMDLTDSHGGWIASAIDLVKFLIHVDGFDNENDILDSSTINLMVEPSEQDSGYAKGWGLEPGGFWVHGGGFSGTSSLFTRTPDGFCWAIVMNGHNYADDFYSDIYNTISEAIKNTY